MPFSSSGSVGIVGLDWKAGPSLDCRPSRNVNDNYLKCYSTLSVIIIAQINNQKNAQALIVILMNRPLGSHRPRI
jgi:hypothetical protein